MKVEHIKVRRANKLVMVVEYVKLFSLIMIISCFSTILIAQLLIVLISLGKATILPIFMLGISIGNILPCLVIAAIGISNDKNQYYEDKIEHKEVK